MRDNGSMIFTKMLKMVVVSSVLVALGKPMSALANDKIRISFGGHPLDQYAVGALQLALKQLGAPLEVSITERSATQGRLKLEVIKGQYDIMWAASTPVDEEDMLPVRFPMLKGLLGYRVLIIHSEDQVRFDKVTTLDELKQFSFGQALDWADTGILKSNGFNVITSSNYPSLFDMMQARRFDAFPRGVVEPWGELAQRDLPNLTVENKLVIVYPMPFYFFVKKDNVSLAKLVELGLEKALANGEFDRYFAQSLEQGFKLDLSVLEGRRFIHLTNPHLTSATPLMRSELWLFSDTIKKAAN